MVLHELKSPTPMSLFKTLFSWLVPSFVPFVQLQISGYYSVDTWIRASRTWFRPAISIKIMNCRNDADSQWPNFKTCHFGWNFICWWFRKWSSAVSTTFPVVCKLQLFWQWEVENRQMVVVRVSECMVIMWMQIFGCEDGSVMKTRNGKRDKKIFFNESSNCTLAHSVLWEVLLH